MSQAGSESGANMKRPNKIDDNRLVKILKNGKPDTWMASETLVHWTSTLHNDRHKIPNMILQEDEEETEDFKVHPWQHSTE